MKAEFLLKHIAIGEFVQVMLSGHGSAYGTLIGADDSALAIVTPEKEGGGITVCAMPDIRNVTGGATARATYDRASVHDEPEVLQGFARALRQMSTAAEHAD